MKFALSFFLSLNIYPNFQSLDLGLIATCSVMLGSVLGGGRELLSIILIQLCILKESSIIFYLLFLYVWKSSEFFHVNKTLNISFSM